MGVELDCLQELASINVACTELSALARIINGEIKAGEFHDRFNTIVGHIGRSFAVVTDNLQALADIESEADLVEKFDQFHAAYTASYLKEISKPRLYLDEAYEAYVLLRLQKEIKTGFPLLKRTFERLDKFIDKWITNDAWLAMAIDNLFKRLQTLFNEVATLRKKDPEQAFFIYASAYLDFGPYLALLRQQAAQLPARSAATPAPDSNTPQYSVAESVMRIKRV